MAREPAALRSGVDRWWVGPQRCRSDAALADKQGGSTEAGRERTRAITIATVAEAYELFA